MPRNLDMTALRAFVAVADAGGVTRAAGLLNLTQSAVSMQIRRLEESLGQGLFLRVARRLSLTPEGEQLLGYARKILVLNDEALSRLTSESYEGEIRLGVPCDIVYPHVPGILKRLAAQYPRVRVNLTTSFTVLLKEGFAKGAYDAVLTTEEHPEPRAEILAAHDLAWIGARDGSAWHRRPLRLGFKETCIFRTAAQAALDRAGIAWEMAVTGESEQVIEASVAADLAVTVRMAGVLPAGCTVIGAGNALPDPGRTQVCLYQSGLRRDEVMDALLCELRCAYGRAGQAAPALAVGR